MCQSKAALWGGQSGEPKQLSVFHTAPKKKRQRGERQTESDGGGEGGLQTVDGVCVWLYSLAPQNEATGERPQ